MPQQPAEEPLTKISVKLFTSDTEWLEATFGWGWTGVIRTLVRKYREEQDGNTRKT